MTEKDISSQPDINNPDHPCYNCINRRSDASKAIIDENTICLDSHTPVPNCRYKLVKELLQILNKEN